MICLLPNCAYLSETSRMLAIHDALQARGADVRVGTHGGPHERALRAAGVDYEVVLYGGAVHAFTQKEAGSDNSKGAAYNEKADHRSWQAMQDFFAEIFR